MKPGNSMRYLRAFGRFWWDFLVGDRLELFLGPIVVLAVAALLVRWGASGLVAGAVLFGLVIVTGALSLALVMAAGRR